MNNDPEEMLGEEISQDDFEVGEEQLLEYAQYLGMDPEKDQKYLFIAREGIKAPVPKEWKALKNESNEIFYFNKITKETSWAHPLDDYYSNLFQKTKEEDQKNELIQ